ncbi:MAG TPA: cysteine dioxygenase [Candidimonas sp.]|nr:cysteine dioxygenase [Candidimonas sp.]
MSATQRANKKLDIAADLDRTLEEIQRLSAARALGDMFPLERAAMLLTQFLSRHTDAFSFEDFPLPIEEGAVLCSYSLTDDHVTPALIVNSIRGGVDSIVHDHGTWAVIVAAQGIELNRVYKRMDAGAEAGSATLALDRETTVQVGAPLVLEQGFFHSIHTVTDVPTLQLHLYGVPLDQITGRQVVDLDTGRLVYLSGPD